MLEKNDRELERVVVIFGPKGDIVSRAKHYAKPTGIRYFNWKRVAFLAVSVLVSAFGTILFFLRS